MKAKKLLSIILSAVMALSLGVPFAAAAGLPTVSVALANKSINVANAASRTQTFTVSIANNSGIGGYALRAKIVDANGADASGITITAGAKGTVAADGFYYNDGAFTSYSTEGDSSNGVLATLTFTLSENTANGTYSVVIMDPESGDAFSDTDNTKINVDLTNVKDSFTVTGGTDSLNNAEVTIPDIVYTGSNITPSVTVKIGGTTVASNRYKVVYNPDTVKNVGTYTATISPNASNANNKLTGSKEVQFKVTKKIASVSLPRNSYTTSFGAQATTVNPTVTTGYDGTLNFTSSDASKVAVTYEKATNTLTITPVAVTTSPVAIKVSAAASDNFEAIAETQLATVTVSKANMAALTGSDLDLAYGQDLTNVKLSASTTNPADASISYAIKSGSSISLGANGAISATNSTGNTVVTATASKANYNDATKDITVRVAEAEFTVIDKKTSYTIVKNAAATDLSGSFEISGLKGSQTATIKYAVKSGDGSKISVTEAGAVTGKANGEAKVVATISAPYHKTQTKEISITVSDKRSANDYITFTRTSESKAYTASEQAASGFASAATLSAPLSDTSKIKYSLNDAPAVASLADLKLKDVGTYKISAIYEDDEYYGKKEIEVAITPVAITGVTGITAAAKAYDGKTDAALTLSGATVTGVLAADASNVSVKSAKGAFANANAGNGKTVNISDIELQGSALKNYTVPANLTSTATANITKLLAKTSENPGGASIVFANTSQKPGSVSAVSASVSPNPVTDGSAVSVTIMYAIPLAEGETNTATGAFSEAPAGYKWAEFAAASEVLQNAGTYTVRAYYAGNDNVGTITEDTTLTVRKASSGGGGNSGPTGPGSGTSVVDVQDNGTAAEDGEGTENQGEEAAANDPTASWTEEEKAAAKAAASEFNDVSETSWAAPAIGYVVEKGLFKGTGYGNFEPAGKATREQVMTVLARFAGETANTTAEGLSWAVKSGISDGSEPAAAVTREQFVTMLYRLIKQNGGGFTGLWQFELESSDASSVSEWANEAMHYAVMEGIITGFEDGTLRPQDEITRAQMATIMKRIDEKGLSTGTAADAE